MAIKRMLFLVDTERVNNVKARSNDTFDATELQNRDFTENFAVSYEVLLTICKSQNK
jgi:hypothetical protein